jgi:hypothetical protein
MPREPDGHLEVLRMDGAGGFTRFTYFSQLTSANWIGLDGSFVYFASSSSRTLSRLPRFDAERTSAPASEPLRRFVHFTRWVVGSQGMYSIDPWGAVMRWRDGRQTDVWEVEGAKLLLGVNARGEALLSFEQGIKVLDPSTGQLSDVVEGLDGVEGAGFSASGSLLVRTRRAIWQFWDLPIRAPLPLPWVELPRQIFDWVIDRNNVYVVVSSHEDIGQASYGGPGWGLYDLAIPPRD